MVTDKLEKLRERLNTMMESEEYTYDEILEVSRELDCFIVEFYKKSLFRNNGD